jgi:hypothetical protein
MTRSLALLLAGGFVCWLVISYPARMVWGDTAVVFSAVAGLLCLVPAGATLIWCQRAFQGAPEQQLLAVLGGTGVRMAFVTGAAVALFLLVDYFHQPSFLIWVVVFYLLALTLEMSLLLSGRSASEPSQKNG